MKKALIMILLMGLVVSLIAVTGCGEKKTTIKTPEGEVTVEEGGGGKYTYETDEGEVTYDVSEGAPSEEELGAPIYPGAEYVEGSGGSVTGTGAEGGFATAGAEFKTDDSYDKVVSFYQKELGPPTYQDASLKQATWMVNATEESFTVVTVSVEEGEVTISIGRMAGTGAP